MKTVFSSAYFPCISYCNQILQAEDPVIDLGEHFVKQTQRNRAYIKGPNGVLKLIVPLEKWKNNAAVKDIRISYAEDWQRLHWRSLESCYRSSPYFEYYEMKFRKLVVELKYDFLYELNAEILSVIFDMLNTEKSVATSLSYLTPHVDITDYRGIDFEPKQEVGRKDYIQVFDESNFISNLSFIDLICNEGPNAIHLLKS